jgi:ElaB/YqjD/DUF883 family membrane-anchored ribosome-binding protein
MSRIGNPVGEGGMASEQMKEKVQQTGQSLRDLGDSARVAAKERLEQARKTASEYYERGKQRAMEWEEGVEDYVRENPMKSLLMAAGAGLLLGIMLRRR